MSETSYADLPQLARHLRSVLADKAQRKPDKSPFVLLYAYNGTGKTRLSTAFKDLGKVADENGEVQSATRSTSTPSPKTCSHGTTTWRTTSSAC